MALFACKLPQSSWSSGDSAPSSSTWVAGTSVTNIIHATSVCSEHGFKKHQWEHHRGPAGPRVQLQSWRHTPTDYQAQPHMLQLSLQGQWQKLGGLAHWLFCGGAQTGKLKVCFMWSLSSSGPGTEVPPIPLCLQPYLPGKIHIFGYLSLVNQCCYLCLKKKRLLVKIVCMSCLKMDRKWIL